MQANFARGIGRYADGNVRYIIRKSNNMHGAIGSKLTACAHSVEKFAGM